MHRAALALVAPEDCGAPQRLLLPLYCCHVQQPHEQAREARYSYARLASSKGDLSRGQGTPPVRFNDLKTESKRDEQQGFTHLFLGLIRPRHSLDPPTEGDESGEGEPGE